MPTAAAGHQVAGRQEREHHPSSCVGVVCMWSRGAVRECGACVKGRVSVAASLARGWGWEVNQRRGVVVVVCLVCCALLSTTRTTALNPSLVWSWCLAWCVGWQACACAPAPCAFAPPTPEGALLLPPIEEAAWEKRKGRRSSSSVDGRQPKTWRGEERETQAGRVNCVQAFVSCLACLVQCVCVAGQLLLVFTSGEAERTVASPPLLPLLPCHASPSPFFLPVMPLTHPPTPFPTGHICHHHRAQPWRTRAP